MSILSTPAPKTGTGTSVPGVVTGYSGQSVKDPTGLMITNSYGQQPYYNSAPQSVYYATPQPAGGIPKSYTGGGGNKLSNYLMDAPSLQNAFMRYMQQMYQIPEGVTASYGNQFYNPQQSQLNYQQAVQGYNNPLANITQQKLGLLGQSQTSNPFTFKGILGVSQLPQYIPTQQNKQNNIYGVNNGI